MLVALFVSLFPLSAMAYDGESEAAVSEPTLRVLSYNIHHGAGTDGKLNLGRIADVIKSANPDVVAVQEVDVKVPRSGKVDQAAELGRLTGMHVVFGKAIELSGGAYGLAVLSNYPIKSTGKIMLPNIRGGEQRILFSAKIEPDNGLPEFTIVNTHFEYIQESIQIAQANTFIEQYGNTTPIILAGDLNATPESQTLDVLKQKLADSTSGITEGTILEHGKIDYVLHGSNDSWRVIDAQVIMNDIASDHRPVLTILGWEEQKLRPRR
ncbi:endonuclease/exonuclease/phosphatase family protein [Paenibacillus sp. J5C2022]|uniref:endonuclease/exonuclease/phosphatase family protein n=1 Tax=Paenibacillus sp. J5C2022 TaxID=2977129 RepID=UPI0021D27AF3|nr:endonuclease/exonuclease/phosphatase family protein [Paenibacillus sp. J5C2022]